ncbi:hypothetical protein D3C87_1647000 [compost metagenome]
MPPLSLVPVMDAESQQLYEVEEPGLDLVVSAPTREQLEADLKAAVAAAAASQSKAWRRRLVPVTTASHQ